MQRKNTELNMWKKTPLFKVNHIMASFNSLLLCICCGHNHVNKDENDDHVILTKDRINIRQPKKEGLQSLLNGENTKKLAENETLEVNDVLKDIPVVLCEKTRFPHDDKVVVTCGGDDEVALAALATIPVVMVPVTVDEDVGAFNIVSCGGDGQDLFEEKRNGPGYRRVTRLTVDNALLSEEK